MSVFSKGVVHVALSCIDYWHHEYDLMFFSALDRLDRIHSFSKVLGWDESVGKVHVEEKSEKFLLGRICVYMAMFLDSPSLLPVPVF